MIGFTGPYSDVNFGDYAMLVNNLQKINPSSSLVFAYDLPFLEKIGDRYFRDLDVKFVTLPKLGNLFTGDRDYRFLTPVEILRSVENLDEIRSLVSELDVLYVNGGGYLNSLWAMPHRIEKLIQILVPALVAASLGKKVVFTANGYGPFRGDLEFFASMFSSLPTARFGARDNLLSPYWLSQLGVASEKVDFLPDDLLFIEDSLMPERPPLIEGRYLVLETYLEVDQIQNTLGDFETFARQIWQQHGLKIVFLPFNLGHGGVDQGKILEDSIETVELFDITELGYLTIEDAVNVVKNAEFVLSNRYHAVILSLSLGVPFGSVLKDVLGDKQYYFSKNVGALNNLLGEIPHDPTDYFFLDYADAMEVIGVKLPEISGRQRTSYALAASGNIDALQRRRDEFFAAVNHE